LVVEQGSKEVARGNRQGGTIAERAGLAAARRTTKTCNAPKIFGAGVSGNGGEGPGRVPEEFDKEWNNVAVTVSTDWPTDADKKRMGVPEEHLVFGTYSGFSRTKGFSASSGSRHVIVIYQPALELCYGSGKE
jgi:hypothetical protein